jgi:hypothetical protein
MAAVEIATESAQHYQLLKHQDDEKAAMGSPKRTVVLARATQPKVIRKASQGRELSNPAMMSVGNFLEQEESRFFEIIRNSKSEEGSSFR